jgi:hypothetical protein
MCGVPSTAMPTPKIGNRLPRAAEAYTTPQKWSDWILAPHGHGREWARIFRVSPTDVEMIWQVLAEGILDATISSVREVKVGVSCEVQVDLTINSRTARVRSAWHYVDPDAAPRLVTAFPTT